MAGHAWNVDKYAPRTLLTAVHLMRVGVYRGYDPELVMLETGYVLSTQRKDLRASPLVPNYLETSRRVLNQLSHMTKHRGSPVDCPWEPLWDWFDESTRLFEPTYGVGAIIERLRINGSPVVPLWAAWWIGFDGEPTLEGIKDKSRGWTDVSAINFVPLPLPLPTSHAHDLRGLNLVSVVRMGAHWRGPEPSYVLDPDGELKKLLLPRE